jgi:hypothetical protein
VNLQDSVSSRHSEVMKMSMDRTCGKFFGSIDLDGLSGDEEKGNDTQEDKSVNEKSRSNDDDDKYKVNQFRYIEL